MNTLDILKETSTSLPPLKEFLLALKVIIDFGLLYFPSNDFQLVEFCDSISARDISYRKSPTSFVFLMRDPFFSKNFKI